MLPTRLSLAVVVSADSEGNVAALVCLAVVVAVLVAVTVCEVNLVV